MRKEEFTALPLLVQQYLLYLEAIKGHSELSVLEYASDLRTFFRFMAKYKGMVSVDAPDEEIDISPIGIDFIKKITLNDAYSYLIYLKNERKNNETTRARRVISIRRFLFI